ncbi:MULTISPECIES: hypothetical protein [unclassified Streptomyces]|uniref:hypothetical protein n=1 Tax=unclassified Streptomyces TaxID=2593676 RepID=UPI000FFF6536|nr:MULTISPECIES: hypothetical protein [unclassified Streptomyces]
MSATTAALLVSGIAVAATPAQADDAGAATASGTACVFSSPQASGLGVGHVGWAVSDPATGRWTFGSADGGGSAEAGSESGAYTSVSASGSVASASTAGVASSVPLGLSASSGAASSMSSASSAAAPSANEDRPLTPGVPVYTPADTPRVWVARADSFDIVRHDFGSFRWYVSYRCKKNIIGADYAKADATAVADSGFNIVTDNCLAHVRSVLLAYQPQIIAGTNFRLFPNDWYDHLADEGFADPEPAPSP